MPTRLRWLIVLLLLLGGGCAPWRQTRDSSPTSATLPTSRLTKDAVVLEIAYIRLSPKLNSIDEEFWSEVDEQHFTTETRRLLEQNGIRCGLLGVQIPERLQQMLESASLAKPGEFQQVQSGEEEISVSTRRLPSRTGQRGEIVTATHTKSAEVLTVMEGKIVGRTYPQAQCKLALVTYPQGDGSVRLELTPEIHFGQPRQRWGAGEGEFHYEVGRQSEVFDKLNIRAMLSPGQTLLVAPTGRLKGLGKQFFLEETANKTHKKLLLIRLAQTQYDDLFAPEQTQQHLITPGQ